MDFVPGFEALFVQRRHRSAEAGIVAQHIEPPEGVLGSGDHVLDIGFVADIAMHTDCDRFIASTGMRGIDGGSNRILIAADVSQHQPRA